jgi:hypothetical protein
MHYWAHSFGTSPEGVEAVVRAAEGDWKPLIDRLQGADVISPIERHLLADLLAELVRNGVLKPPKGAREGARRYAMAKYVEGLRSAGVRKTEAVRRAADEFQVESNVVWRALRELDEAAEMVWQSPYDHED